MGKVSVAVGHRGRGGRVLDQEAARAAAEGDGGDLVDPRHRDQHQGNQQDQSQRQGKGGAEHEVVAVPVAEHRGGPGTDAVGRGREQQGLHHGGPLQPQDRQRHQDADQEGDGGELPVVRVHDRSGPGEFRLAGCVQEAPIGTDAALEELPGLVDRLDDVVLHADGLGTGDEIAQRHRLFQRARLGIAQVVAGTRPAEFGDHDPLAGELVAQQLVHGDGLVHRLLVGEVFPIGQNVRANEVHGIGELRMVAPNVPDFTCCHRNIDGFLNPLD